MRSSNGTERSWLSGPASKGWQGYLDVPKRLVFQLGTGLLKEEEGKPTFFFTIL